MKLQTKQFRAALAETGRVIKGRSTMPAAQCVRLSMTDDDRLQLEATNFDAWITRKVDCAEWIEPVLVNHQMLSRILDTIGDESSDLLFSGSKLTIKSQDVDVLNTLDVKEFPAFADYGGVALAVNAQDLAEGLEAVNWCAGDDKSSKESYRSANVVLSATKLTCGAASGPTMALFTRAAICESRTLLLPALLVPALLPDLSAKKADLFVSDNWLGVKHPNGSAAIKQSAGESIPFDKITALRGTSKGTMIDRERLKIACVKAMIHTPEANYAEVNAVRDGDNVNVSCPNGAYNGTFEAPGQELNMRVSADKLNTALSKSMADEVRIVTCPNAVFIEMGDILVAIGQLVDKPKQPQTTGK